MRGMRGRSGAGAALLGGSLVLGLMGPAWVRAEGSREDSGASRRKALEERVQGVKWARGGARERLADPACLAVLSDFTTVTGLRLDEELRATGRTAQEQMDRLIFESGLGREECREGRQAYTRIGSDTVWICPRAFTLLPPRERQAVLIHEMLHSLLLGENPPDSVAITRQVLKRCGR
jgi:hypothetical protein